MTNTIKSILIVTVGTGTKGPQSNLAQGLVNTLKELRPRLFWLVPSASADSIAIADMVRESAPQCCMFQPWTESQPFRQIEHHDDLFNCRTALREVIQRSKVQLQQGERLLVNPTSGTKQMSVAAMLAALDEEIGEVVFTIGDRADGVVITGTEQMKSFKTDVFFMERDLRTADELFRAGAFQAAAKILERYKADDRGAKAHFSALCLHEWQRLNHQKAASHAARFSEPLSKHLKNLTNEDDYSAAKVGDLLAGADELARWGDHEEALARYYRAAEQIAKTRLAQAFGIGYSCRRDDLLSIVDPKSNAQLFDDIRNGHPKPNLTLKLSWDILGAAGDSMAEAYLSDRQLHDGLQQRNDGLYGHGQASVDSNLTRKVATRLRVLLKEHFPAVADCWNTEHRPKSILRT